MKNKADIVEYKNILIMCEEKDAKKTDQINVIKPTVNNIVGFFVL